MKPFSSKQSRSVVFSWITSYLLLILVMVIMMGSVYFIATDTIDTEINNSNKLLLEIIRNNIDERLVQVNDLSMDILTSNEIQMAGSLNAQDRELYLKLFQATRSLANYRIITNPMQSFYIFVEHTDRIIIPGAVNYSRLFYQQYISQSEYTYEEWLDIVSKSYAGSFVPLSFFPGGSGNMYNLAYIRSIPMSYLNEYVANIVIMLDFSSVLSPMGENRSLILILDGDNNVMAQSDDSVFFNAFELPVMEGSQGMFDRQTENGKEVISFIASRFNDWKYITVTPDSIYWERSSFIRGVMLGGIALCLLGMGLLAFYFVRRNYNILQEVTSFVRSKLHSEAAWGGNEYEYIRHALSSSFEQREEFNDKLDRQNSVLRKSVLTSLIEERELSVPTDEMLTLCNIDFTHPYYSVIIVYLENINRELWVSGDDDDDVEVFDLAKFAVLNIIEEVIGRNHNAYIIEVNDLALCLVNTSMQWSTFHKSLNSELTDARDFIARNLDIDLSLAIGGLHDSVESIHQSYIEAQGALAYARVFAKGKNVFANDIGEETKEAGAYFLDAKQQILNHIHLSDADAAIRTLQEKVFNSNITNYSVPGTGVRIAIIALAFDLLRSVSPDEHGFTQLIGKNEIMLERLMRAPAVTSMQEPFAEILLSLTKDSEHAENKNGDSLGVVMQEYIRHHFTDANLSISSLAASIGKTPYYVSKIFKIQTGFGILDYINRVRIDAAKLLIQENRLTQEQIAEKVGFTNVRTFQRVFKKIEGVPPGRLKPQTIS